MAYTRTPEFNSHQVKRLPVVGSHTLPSFLQTGTGMKYYNCFPRKVEQFGTDPVHILEKVPYWTTVATSIMPAGDLGALRGAYKTDSPNGTNQNCVVIDNDFYVNGVAKITMIKTTGYVGICEANIAGTHYIVLLENDSTAARIHTYETGAGAVTTTNLSIGAQGDPIFLNGRIYVAGYRTQRIYNSNVGTVSTFTTANDFIDAEMVGDAIVTLALHRNHLVALGTRSVEFFYDNAVDIGSPLQRQETYATMIGASLLYDSFVRPKTCTIANDTYFNGEVAGVRGLYRIRDFKVQKVSDAYIDRLLNAHHTTVYEAGLFPASFNGSPVLCFSNYKLGDSASHVLFAYSIEDNVWVQCSLPNTGTYDIIPVFSFIIDQNTYVFGSDASTGDARARKWTYINEDSVSPAGGTVDAYMIFDTFDGGTELQKHFKYVDVIGDMGDNTVTLTFTKESSKESTTYTSSNDSAGDPIRFRNLCRAKRINLKVGFSGKTQIEFRGLDVAFNQGTV